MKALTTIGWDDCNNTANNWVLSVMREHGIRASFNLIGNALSGLTGDYTDMDMNTHSYTHANLVDETDQNVMIGEFKDGLAAIKSWAETYAQPGNVGKGMAWSNNNQPNDSYTKFWSWLRGDTSGLEFARKGSVKATVDLDTAFALPDDWFNWVSTATFTSGFIYQVDGNYLTTGEEEDYKKSVTILDKFVDEAYQPAELKVCYVWGHPVEAQPHTVSTSMRNDISAKTAYYPNSGWNFDMLIDTYNAHRDDVWLATQTELYEYVEAVNGLKVSDAKIINDSEVDVYVRIDSEYVTVPAKGSASL